MIFKSRKITTESVANQQPIVHSALTNDSTKQLRNTVLFICKKPVFLNMLIALRHSMFKNNYAVLLCKSAYKSKKYAYIQRFKEQGVFDDVIFLDLDNLDTINNPTKSSQSDEDWLIEKIDSQWRNTSYDLAFFKHVVLAIDISEQMLSLYLHLKNKPFYIIEHTTRRLANAADAVAKKRYRRFSEKSWELVNRYNAWDVTCSSLATAIYYHDTPATKYLAQDLHVKFNYLHEIKLLDHEIQTKLLKAYDFDFKKTGITGLKRQNHAIFYGSSHYLPESGRSDIVAIFSSKLHTIVANPLTMQNAITQLAMDYFLSEDSMIWIKYHPTKGEPKNHKLLYPKVNVFPNIPGEFLHFDENYRNHQWSGRVSFREYSSFSEDNPNNTTLNFQFYRVACYLHKLYFGFRLLNLDDYTELVYDEADLIAPFISKYYPSQLHKLKNRASQPSKRLVVLREPLDYLTANSKIEMNADNTAFLILDIGEAPYIEGFATQRFVISKEALRDKGRMLTTAEETFYLLTKNPLSMPTLLNKTLQICGLELVCSQVQED